jgi:dienelactone hydrolase
MRSGMQAILEVEPARGLVDTPLLIRLSGLAPRQRVLLTASQPDDYGRTWCAHAEFEADAAGAVAVAEQAPVSGTYHGVDAMGLVWSMGLEPNEPNQAPFFRKEPTPLRLALTAEVGGSVVAQRTVERLYVADGVERILVRDQGMVGTLFVPPGDGPHPVVISVSGSGGGLSESGAALYASHGYAGLALAYFNAETLPPDLIDIPLEYFERAIDWLQHQPRIDANRIAVSGTSRGGELALLLGATFAAIKAVVAYVPSGIVFGGIGRDGVRGARAAWTFRGQPVPFLQPRPKLLSPEPPPAAPDEAVRLTDRFLRMMEDQAAVERVEIPVERINGPVIMLSGKDDAMWPSTRLAEIACRRLEERHFKHPFMHIAYEGAGHMIGTPYTPSTIVASRHPLTGGLNAYGGTPPAYAAAREDSWRRILGMLDAAFSTSHEAVVA